MTSKLLWPYKEDVVRFDFEVAGEDESVVRAMAGGMIGGLSGNGEVSVDHAL